MLFSSLIYSFFAPSHSLFHCDDHRCLRILSLSSVGHFFLADETLSLAHLADTPPSETPPVYVLSTIHLENMILGGCMHVCTYMYIVCMFVCQVKLLGHDIHFFCTV